MFPHRPVSRARCLSSRRKREDFLGINNFIFILGFSFGGVLQTLNSEKVNFDAEKVTNLSIAQHRFVHHCSYRTAVNCR